MVAALIAERSVNIVILYEAREWHSVALLSHKAVFGGGYRCSLGVGLAVKNGNCFNYEYGAELARKGKPGKISFVLMMPFN